MLLKVSNQLEIENPTQDIWNYCEEKLTLTNPDYLSAERAGRWTGKIDPKIYLYYIRGNTLVLPFGCLKDIWKYIDKYETNFHAVWGNKLQGGINLYDYQENAIQAILRAKGGILEAPCGSGKTNIGLELIHRNGGRALWLTHTQKLLEQSMQRCKDYFTGDFGTITEGKVHIGGDITFATVQTMSKLDVSVYKDAFDIVVVDEVHRASGSPTKMRQFYKVITNCNARYKYGLSATLSRADGMIESTFAIVGRVSYTIPKSAVGDKIIKAIHSPVMIDLKYSIRDYINSDGTINHIKLMNMLSYDNRRNDIIIDKVREEYEKGRKQIILCHRVAQAEELQRRISRFAKVNLLIGKVGSKHREYDANIIIATYSLAKEGLDIPALDVLHLATPQKNASTTEQAVGRIERNIQGKSQPICYDYVDTNVPYCMACYKKRRAILKRH